jgi:hypothetical protein
MSSLKRCAVLCGVWALGSGCDFEKEWNTITGADYDIPVEQETPETTIDIGQQITRLEDQLNSKKNDSTEDMERYKILLAVCKTEPNKVCEPTARLPVRVPRYVWPAGCIDATTVPPTIHTAEECTAPMACEETDPAALEAYLANPGPTAPAGNGCVDVSKWISQIPNIADYTTVAGAVHFDVSSQGSLKDVSVVKKVTVTKVQVNYKENTFNYPIPSTEAFVGAPASDQETADAKKLIADNKVTKFGTLPVTPETYTGSKTMALEADGKAKLSDAIRGFKATLAARAALTVPPDTDANRQDNCRDPAHLVNSADYCESFPKPDGHLKVSLTVAVTFTFNARN